MKRAWLRYLAGGSGLVVLLYSSPVPVAAAGNAGVHLHKTVDAAQVTITPNLGLALGVDKSSAIPGDKLTYTAVVTDPTATLGMGGFINAEATSSTDAIVSYYWDELQSCAQGCGSGAADPHWSGVATFEAGLPGYQPVTPPDVHTGLTLVALTVARSGVTYPTSGDPILGTDISPAATAGWTYSSAVVLTPAQIAVLSDPSKTQAVRNVLHFEVTARNSTAAQPFTDPEAFANPFTTTSNGAAVTNVTVTYTLPDGSTTAVGPSQVASLASIAPGGSVVTKATFTVPAPAARGASETEAAYVTRLRNIEGSALTGTAGAAGTGFSGPVSASSSPVTTNEFVPIVTIAKGGPAQVDAGATETNQLTLTNGGDAPATSITVTDSVPGGSAGSVTGVPSSLAGAASGTAVATYAVPASQAAGDLTDTASVTWKDANGNPYGPLSSSFTTQVRNILFNARLTLAPATAGPNVPGTTQTLTATLLDRNGNPISGQVVRFTVTGANPTTGSAGTDVNGIATFAYAGTNQGDDVAQATVTAPGITIQSNTSTITWLNALQPVATTVVQGNFFDNPTNVCHFGADTTTPPLFSQSFPNIMFNPDPAIFKVPPPFIRPDSNGVVFNISTRPFTDVTTDINGNPSGLIVAQGNGIQAGSSVTNFFASFTGNFVVHQAGDLTFRILHDDGYLLGVGGAATRVSGDYEGDVIPATTPFNGYPTLAAWNTSSTGSSSSGPATVHFPAPGVYPFELDYTECGGGPLFLDLLTEKFIAQTSPLSVYVGYADGLRPAGSIFPFPWSGSPNVTFYGCPLPCQFDGGAIRIDNSGSTPAQIDSITVDIPFAVGVNDCPGVTHFDIWPHNLTIPAGQIVVVGPEAPGTTCAGAAPFDTSDTSFYCGPDTGVIPVVNVTSGGVTTSFNDTTQVLNTGGRDQADCGGNESLSWQRIGGGGTAVNLPLPPAASLSLTPFNVPDAVQGQSTTETVAAMDGAGNPLSNLPVTLSVFGPNAQTQTASTGTSGLVTFTFGGNLPGTDTVQASAFVEGLRAISNNGTVVWTPTGGTNNPLAPSITVPTPFDGSVITKPVPVDATIAPPSGHTVTSWRVFYQAAAGGPQVVIGSGSGMPPSPLGVTFDPTIVAD
ncbi:MAG TPA: Ig-like domain-containing protein, partial [Candidatus Dormibacteraeota bacterium]|nr:Ig-like domain-containing protein [Candidatus Dormibacteraeota bacterium]